MENKKARLSVWIMGAMAAGVIAGMVLGKGASGLGDVGKIIIQLIKAAASPLLFLVIVTSILKTEVRLKSGLRMVGVASFNAVIALVIGLSLSAWLQPGLHMTAGQTIAPAGAAPTTAQKLDFAKSLGGFMPTSFVEPFVSNAVMSLVFIGLLVGFGLRRVRGGVNAAAAAKIEEILQALLELTEVMMGWIIRLVPIAVFAVVAKSVGENGFEPLKGLAAYVGVALLGLTIQVVVTYQLWIKFFAKIKLRAFWREAKEPVLYSVGANSSLATLPVTLNALDRLKVSRHASTLGACVGTNFNNDGIILYEAMAVLFVAQAHGIHLTTPEQIMAAFSCMVAAMGIAGVPEAGFISLSLVLGTLGMPIELLPLLLTVDWVVARGRSVVNVLSDMVVSIAIDKFEKKAQ